MILSFATNIFTYYFLKTTCLEKIMKTGPREYQWVFNFIRMNDNLVQKICRYGTGRWQIVDRQRSHGSKSRMDIVCFLSAKVTCMAPTPLSLVFNLIFLLTNNMFQKSSHHENTSLRTRDPTKPSRSNLLLSRQVTQGRLCITTTLCS